MISTDGAIPPAKEKTFHFLRSVRLDRDLDRDDVLANYVVTPQVVQILRQAAGALATESTDRAWTITGPYGTGKSFCALFLARLVRSIRRDEDDHRDPSWSILREQAPEVAQDLEQALRRIGGLHPLPVTLRPAPLTRCLHEAILKAAERLPALPARERLIADIADSSRVAGVDPRQVVNLIVRLKGLNVTMGQSGGLLIVLDELGKALEYAAHYGRDDIYLLQELAETAHRSGHQPILLVGILHQSFDRYVYRLGTFRREEWSKIQGRFRDVVFLEPAEQLILLASQAVDQITSGATSKDLLGSRAENVAGILLAQGLAPGNLARHDLGRLARAAAPLHPMTLLALPYLFRRLAQNERSMFTYLRSDEPFGFREILRDHPDRLVRLPDLFDYCAANVTGLLAGQGISRRWIEISDALDRAPGLPAVHVEVLKTVGILGFLGEFSHLKATPEAVALALDDAPRSERIQAVLEDLRARSLLVFRRFDGSYRIWEGGDVDVDTRLQEVRRQLGIHLDLPATLQRYLPRRSIVARRHSYESGAVRYFDLQYISSPVVPNTLQPGNAADGVIVLCLADTSAEVEAFRQWASDPSLDWPRNVVVVVPIEIRQLREAAAELRALRWLRENTPELRDDRIARREIAERLAAVERAVIELVDCLLDPRPEPFGTSAIWFHRGQDVEAKEPVSARQYLSTVMDDLYAASPRIKNELINRRVLSSAAAAARRTLIERMLMRSGEKLLGIEGYPPERSMYESILLDSGLHREVDSLWVFGPPPENDPRGLRPTWDEIYRVVFRATTEPVSVDLLFARLAAPPLGVMPGVLPVLLAAFLLAYSEETNLYREGRFIPEPAIADFEVLMRRPELFAVAGCRVKGARAAVLERFARSLRVRPAIVPVVRALIRGVRALPETSWRTRRVSPLVLAVRQAFEQAKAPDRLLFTELPAAVAEKPFSDQDQIDQEHVERFFTKLNTALSEWTRHASGQVEWAQGVLLDACGLPPAPDGWGILIDQARRLLDQPIDPELIPFIRRLTSSGDQRAVLESVLALVASKPPKSWSDLDVDQFPAHARALGQRFRYAYEVIAPLSTEEWMARDELSDRIRQMLAGVPSRVARSALGTLLSELSIRQEG